VTRGIAEGHESGDSKIVDGIDVSLRSKILLAELEVVLELLGAGDRTERKGEGDRYPGLEMPGPAHPS
jgi:hypothetical protein